VLGQMIKNRISNKIGRNVERNVNITLFIETERKGNGCYVTESQDKESSCEAPFKGKKY
jgi:hypothetical protein